MAPFMMRLLCQVLAVKNRGADHQGHRSGEQN